MLKSDPRSALPSPGAPALVQDSRFDYERLAQEIFCHLRGELSQRQLSERLGFSFNQVGKWESGVTRIKWEDFLHLAATLSLSLESSFRNFFPVFDGEFNALNTLRAIEKVLTLSSAEEFPDRGLVKKWLKGSSALYFSTILEAFDIRPAMLIGWLSSFLDCGKLPLLEKSYKTFLLRMESVLKDPNCVYVNAALQLRAYQTLERHDEELLAEHAACTVPQLRRTLATMKAHGIISYDGKKYSPCAFDFSFSAVPSPKLRGLTKYTTVLAAERYPTGRIAIDPAKTPNATAGSVRVAAMSSDASRKVRDLIVKFHNGVAEIVRQDQLPKDNVQIILLHSFASNINPPGRTGNGS